MTTEPDGVTTPPPTKPARKVGRPCLVCQHERRAEIESAIVRGEDDPKISGRFGLDRKAIGRHRRDHIPTPAMQAAVAEREAEQGAHGLDLLASADELRRRALDLLGQAEAAKDLRAALAGVREAARCLELMAKLRGEIDTSTQLNVTFAPVFVELSQLVLAALSSFPAAKAAVAHALASISATPEPLMLEGRAI